MAEFVKRSVNEAEGLSPGEFPQKVRNRKRSSLKGNNK